MQSMTIQKYTPKCTITQEDTRNLEDHAIRDAPKFTSTLEDARNQIGTSAPLVSLFI